MEAISEQRLEHLPKLGTGWGGLPRRLGIDIVVSIGNPFAGSCWHRQLVIFQVVRITDHTGQAEARFRNPISRYENSRTASSRLSIDLAGLDRSYFKRERRSGLRLRNTPRCRYSDCAGQQQIGRQDPVPSAIQHIGSPSVASIDDIRRSPTRAV